MPENQKDKQFLDKFSNFFWNYTYNNWKLTPVSKKALYQASAIIGAGILMSIYISKKK